MGGDYLNTASHNANTAVQRLHNQYIPNNINRPISKWAIFFLSSQSFAIRVGNTNIISSAVICLWVKYVGLGL